MQKVSLFYIDRWSRFGTYLFVFISNVFLHRCISPPPPMPSVLWHCWLGGRKGIRPVKTEWWGACMVICLERCADLHMARLIPLPLTVSCFTKIQIGFTFLVPVHPDTPGHRGVKRVCVCALGRRPARRCRQWPGTSTSYCTTCRRRPAMSSRCALSKERRPVSTPPPSPTPPSRPVTRARLPVLQDYEWL